MAVANHDRPIDVPVETVTIYTRFRSIPDGETPVPVAAGRVRWANGRS